VSKASKVLSVPVFKVQAALKAFKASKERKASKEYKEYRVLVYKELRVHKV
jgi:hypothetical protein